MNLSILKKNVTRRVLVFVLPLVLIFGAYVPSAEAGPRHHRGRHGYHQRHHHGYRHGNGRYYRHRGYGNRHRHGYWRYHRGHRYWYENGGYYASPGGLRIVIGL